MLRNTAACVTELSWMTWYYCFQVSPGEFVSLDALCLSLTAHVDGEDLEAVRVAIDQPHHGDVELSLQSLQEQAGGHVLKEKRKPTQALACSNQPPGATTERQTRSRVKLRV